MYSKDTMYRIIWNNGRYDGSMITDIQELMAEKYFSKKQAMFYEPPPMNVPSPVLDHARYLSDGMGIINSSVA